MTITWACKNCFYWDVDHRLLTPVMKDGEVEKMTSGLMGRCRFSPPTGAQHGRAQNFPVVHQDDWCGRFTTEDEVKE